MIGGKFHIIDESGIKWWVQSDDASIAVPYCVKDHLPLRNPPWASDKYFICDDCGAKYISRSSGHQPDYVISKLNAAAVAKYDVVNYNGELVPIAKVKSKDEDYWVTAQIMDSKHGKQLVVYAGKKGMDGKMQAFVDTENHKLAFDHKDIKPTDIFTKLEATFKDGSKMSMDAPLEET